MENSREVILTYDIGTTGNKCSLITSAGRVVGSVTVAYPTDYPRPGWAQQNPADYWKSAVTGTRQLKERFGDSFSHIAGIGLSGHMNGMIAVDRSGLPLYPEIIHADSRSSSKVSWVTERIDEHSFFCITGNRVDPHLGLTKILWFKDHYPDLYRRTASFIQSKDFIVAKLTGGAGHSTDYSDASLMCAFDLSKKTWSKELINLLDLDLEKFPDLSGSSEIVGTLSAEAAGLLRLPVGLPVAAGGGDAACSTRGAGVADRQTAMNCIGSSSWISLLSEKPLLDAGMRIQNFYDIDGVSNTICGTVQSAGIAIDWAVDLLGTLSGEERDYRLFEQLAGESKPGADGLFFIPYLMGERTPHWNQDLKGGLIGLTLGHGRIETSRAVLEGVAFALRDVLAVFRENQFSIDHLILSGGGAVSPFWNQMLSTILDSRVTAAAEAKQTTSLGAAIAALVGLGIYDSFDTAAGNIALGGSWNPEKSEAAEYSILFAVYQELYDSYAALCSILSKHT